MIDMHSHIVYGIDDGAKSEEMSLKMLTLSKENGVDEIVATPHFMKGRFNYEYQEVIKLVEKLQRLAEENGIDIKIYCGQEVYYSKNLIEYYNEGVIGTINNSKYMLIELPMIEFNIEEVIDSIYELQIRGITPIIAHPERYKLFIKKPSMINKFISEGYLFQLNSGSVVGDFGKDVKKTAKVFLDHNIYSVVGSDAHRDRGRSTDVNEFLNIIDEKCRINLKNNSQKILNNKEIESGAIKIKEKKWFWQK